MVEKIIQCGYPSVENPELMPICGDPTFSTKGSNIKFPLKTDNLDQWKTWLEWYLDGEEVKVLTDGWIFTGQLVEIRARTASYRGGEVQEYFAEFTGVADE